MPRQPGSLPTQIPDSASTGLVQVSDSSGDLSWQSVTALTGANVSLCGAPSGATGVTFDRAMAAATSAPANAGGTLYVRAIALPSGIAVNNITFIVDSTVQVTGTHGWYVLLDSSRVVRAVSADQTSTVWGTASTPVTLPVSGPAYTTTYSGLYYAGFCTVSATNPVFMGGVTTSSIFTNLPPVLMGTSGTGLSTPPALGATMTAITGHASYNFLDWTS